MPKEMKKLLFSSRDIERLECAVVDIEDKRKQNIKSSIELDLSCGTAKLYHMSSDKAPNPVVRIDLRIGG